MFTKSRFRNRPEDPRGLPCNAERASAGSMAVSAQGHDDRRDWSRGNVRAHDTRDGIAVRDAETNQTKFLGAQHQFLGF